MKFPQFLMKFSGVYVLIVLLSMLLGCTSSQPNETPEVTYVTDADFTDAKQVYTKLANGFELSLWAPGPLLSNAVALSFDNDGVAYISETSRRKSSDIDIRQHRDWMVEDIALQTLEDTEAFHRKKLDPSLSDQNRWQRDFNGDSLHDWRDLQVQSEYIRRVWDSDGDGRADASSIYAQGFNSMLTGVAAGILYHEGEVFLTAVPGVWRLKDEDGDGDADQRTEISHGYGIHIAYAGHDMSGLVMGPDGRVYWSIGDMGVNVVDQEGKRWAYPNQGAVMRANPDGSEFEVFAHGLRNPQELAFDAYGNLISVDNDGDHAGEHERFVHIIEGSDSGWRIYWQFGKYNHPHEEYKVWMDEKLHLPHFPGQAAYLLPAIALASDGPAGLAYNPGTALSEEWKGYFFASYFTGSSARSKIQAFKLTPKGASFQLSEQLDILTGVVSTGISFGPDGALYINDWLDGYQLKPQGRIWKLDVADTQKNGARLETQQLLQKGMKNSSSSALSVLMAHADMRVRMAAQFELVKRQGSEALLATVDTSESQFARLHAIWGLGQLARQDSNQSILLLPYLLHDDEHVRAQTAKVLGEVRYPLALYALLAQIQDSSAIARFFAVEALGKLGNPIAFDPLIGLLEKVGDSDPHLRHAIVYALSHLDSEAGLSELSKHPSLDIRIGAVVALRHLQSPKVADFLSDEEPWVVTEAARAIHDDQSIPAALAALASSLTNAKVKDEAFLRRAINANLRLGDAKSAERLGDFANNQSASAKMRAEALFALAYWKEPPLLDRVEGRYRKLSGHQLADAHEVLNSYFQLLLNAQAEEVRIAAVEVAGRLNYAPAEAAIFPLIKNKRQTVEVRQAALATLAQLPSDRIIEALNIALEDPNIKLRKDAQTLIGQLALSESTVISMLTKVLNNGSIPEKQKALSSMAGLSSSEAEQLLAGWMNRLTKGELAAELQLDVLMAVEQSKAESLKAMLAAYEASKASGDPSQSYSETTYGGDKTKGRQIFYNNNSAQCIRCHQINGVGGEVGPSLSLIARDLSPNELLAALVDPNSKLAPGYGTVILEVKDGKKIVGTISAENEEEIKLLDASNTLHQIPKAEIVSRKDAPSAMPSLAGVLSKKEIRDVMAFLLSLK